MAASNPDDLFKLFDLEDDEQPAALGHRIDITQSSPIPSQAGDTADSWMRIVGNAELTQVMKAFVTHQEPRHHILVYGSNRSGKTYTIHTALKAKFCRARQDNLDPCNQCKSCRTWDSGVWDRVGCFRNREGNDYRYYMIDGTNPSTFDEDLICRYRDRSCPLVLFIDEVSHPEFIKLMPRLIKPMTETPMTIVACGVRLGPRKDNVTGFKSPGLSKDFVYRFARLVRTSAPAPEDFLRWLRGEYERRGFTPDDDTLKMIIERAGNIPGQALRPLMAAKLEKRSVTRQFIEKYCWEV